MHIVGLPKKIIDFIDRTVWKFQGQTFWLLFFAHQYLQLTQFESELSNGKNISECSKFPAGKGGAVPMSVASLHVFLGFVLQIYAKFFLISYNLFPK